MTDPAHHDTIARELDLLGEAPLDADELALLERGDVEAEPEVGDTARHLRDSVLGLSDIERERVWRKVESGRARERARKTAPWVLVSLALAAAVALVVIVLPEPERGPDAAEVAEIGEQARASLRVLDDGLADTARSERLLADYERRLEEGT